MADNDGMKVPRRSSGGQMFASVGVPSCSAVLSNPCTDVCVQYRQITSSPCRQTLRSGFFPDL